MGLGRPAGKDERGAIGIPYYLLAGLRMVARPAQRSQRLRCEANAGEAWELRSLGGRPHEVCGTQELAELAKRCEARKPLAKIS